MAALDERLDKIKELIQQEDFLKGKGLSNEFNIRIFCYEPKEEMKIRHYVEKLHSEQLTCNLVEVDLYKLFLNILESKKILERVPQLEEKRGKKVLQNQFERSISPKTFAENIKIENPTGKDVVVLTGVGKVFPFVRIHGLLEAMQPHFEGVPILVFYPGDYDGRTVRLFNKLNPNDYYRAFKTI